MKKQSIEVEVLPLYLDSESDPDRQHYVWAYCVVITNNMKEPVTLRHRFWNILEQTGKMRCVSGEGVIGEQPTILPNTTYSYTSGATLAVPSGFMFGEYDMEGECSGSFKVKIPLFSLDHPTEKHLEC